MFSFKWNKSELATQSNAKRVVRRMQLNNLFIIGLVTLTMSSMLSVMMYWDAKKAQVTRTETFAQLWAQNLQPALVFADDAQVKKQLGLLQRQFDIIDITQARVYRADNTLLAAYQASSHWDSKLAQGNAASAVQQFVAADYLNTWLSLWERLHTVVPLRNLDANGELLGHLVLTSDMTEPRDEILFEMASIFFIGLCSFLVMAYRLQKIAEPLEVMLTSMRRVMPTSHEETIGMPIKARKEIGDITDVFNAMVVEIEQRDQALSLELSQRKAAEAQLEITAKYDVVTHLPNRHAFNSEIELAYKRFVAAHNNFALMFIDLDNFKYVNDNFGHNAGDLLLLSVGERIRHLLRAEDFVARIGGDEFVVIVHNFSELDQVSRIAGKIIEELRKPFALDANEAFIGASIGITTCPKHCVVFSELVRQADSAMYFAKKMGKNNYQYFHDGLAADVEARVKMEGELRHAVAEQQIRTHYQPIVSLHNQQIIGFEALLRWTLADGTEVEPEQFVPLAEEIGLIAEMGDFIVAEAIAQTKIWQQQHPDIFTSVNFSPRQFRDRRLASKLLAQLKAADLHPRHIEMEITESVLMKNTADSIALLNELDAAGMRIAIDDFGTGYSSLSYLTQFPAHKLKIDKSFVAKLPHDKQALAIVTAIIGLAHSLNLVVVAEGIETDAQLSCLQGLGCQLGQGFLFSKALSGASASASLVNEVSLVA
ncbi:MAG: putative bifunctional diguanylate cyclase/phosphodiesterase [Gallionella sp.]